MGEIIGTGIIGSIISYPVMTFIVGREGLSLFFYTPMFLGATVMGGGAAYLLLKALAANTVLPKMQKKLGGRSYEV